MQKKKIVERDKSPSVRDIKIFDYNKTRDFQFENKDGKTNAEITNYLIELKHMKDLEKHIFKNYISPGLEILNKKKRKAKKPSTELKNRMNIKCKLGDASI